MTQIETAELAKRIEWCVLRAAAPIYRRYKDHVHMEDVRQELWLWALGHKDTTRELLGRSDGFLVRRLRSVAERYARREKAARGGYSPADECFYSLTQIANLLPEALDPTSAGSGAAGSKVSGTSETYMEWETSIADIRGAVAKLQPEPRGRLSQWVGHMDMAAIPEDIKAILRQIQMRLGGPRPDNGESK